MQDIVHGIALITTQRIVLCADAEYDEEKSIKHKQLKEGMRNAKVPIPFSQYKSTHKELLPTTVSWP